MKPHTALRSMTRRSCVAGLPCFLLLVLVALATMAMPAMADVQRRDQDETVWKSLRKAHFAEREIADGQGVVSLDAPYRAEDPSVVPITITDERAGSDEPAIRRLWLVIDNNPVPMSARFDFGPAAKSATIATRVRVNSYTYMRVIAETSDDKLYMVKKYVKASGGCSAPIGRDLDKAREHMGQMRLRTVRAGADGATRTQLMIRHPNITGLQMDQLTRLVEPAHFVDAITVRKGDALVFDSSMTFSLSANPSLQFSVRDGMPGELSARVQDNEDNEFIQAWPASSAGQTQPQGTTS